jgi:hypothetical protein
VTSTAAAIVTALVNGPATARDLSQRLDGIGYANIRQHLRRLAAAGVVTKRQWGVYGLPGESAITTSGSADPTDETPAARAPVPVVTGEALAAALADVWTGFEAQNNPHDERAWA